MKIERKQRQLHFLCIWIPTSKHLIFQWGGVICQKCTSDFMPSGSGAFGGSSTRPSCISGFAPSWPVPWLSRCQDVRSTRTMLCRNCFRRCWSVRACAARTLHLIGPPAVPVLTSSLEDQKSTATARGDPVGMHRSSGNWIGHIEIRPHRFGGEGVLIGGQQQH